MNIRKRVSLVFTAAMLHYGSVAIAQTMPPTRELLFQLGVGAPLNERITFPDGLITRTLTDASGSARATGQADWGLLRATASAAPLDGRSMMAGSSAFVRDVITITAPGLEGQLGFLDVKVAWDWSFDQVGGYAASYARAIFAAGFNSSLGYTELFVQEEWQTEACPAVVGCAIDNSLRAALLNPDGSFANLTPTPLLSARVPFRFGQPLSVSLESDLTVVATGAGGSTSWSLNADRSFSWEGISDITTFDGVSVNASVTSFSGTNYLAPVPEPSALVMLSLGLFILGGCRLYALGRSPNARIGLCAIA